MGDGWQNLMTREMTFFNQNSLLLALIVSNSRTFKLRSIKILFCKENKMWSFCFCFYSSCILQMVSYKGFVSYYNLTDPLACYTCIFMTFWSKRSIWFRSFRKKDIHRNVLVWWYTSKSTLSALMFITPLLTSQNTATITQSYFNVTVL